MSLPETHSYYDADEEGEETKGDDLPHGIGVEDSSAQKTSFLTETKHILRSGQRPL